MLKKALGNARAIQPVVALVVLIEVIITVSLRDLRAVLRKFYGGTVNPCQRAFREVCSARW